MHLVPGWPVDLEARRRLEAQTGRPLPTVYPGSVKGTCCRCGLEIWIGPLSQAAIAEMIAEPICHPCAAAEGAALCISPGNPEDIDPTRRPSSN
jgi:hypothetical protein